MRGRWLDGHSPDPLQRVWFMPVVLCHYPLQPFYLLSALIWTISHTVSSRWVICVVHEESFCVKWVNTQVGMWSKATKGTVYVQIKTVSS